MQLLLYKTKAKEKEEKLHAHTVLREKGKNNVIIFDVYSVTIKYVVMLVNKRKTAEALN